jgi:hypothetical protein
VAVVLAAALAAYPLVRAGSLLPAVAALAVVGLPCTLLAIFVRARFAGVTLFTLAAAYVLVEATGRAGRFSVVAYAAGLVVLAELLLWPAQMPSGARVDRRAVTLWLRNVAAVAVAGAVLGIVALAASGFQIPGTSAGALVGGAAALALLALPRLLLGRMGERRKGERGRGERAG